MYRKINAIGVFRGRQKVCTGKTRISWNDHKALGANYPSLQSLAIAQYPRPKERLVYPRYTQEELSLTETGRKGGVNSGRVTDNLKLEDKRREMDLHLVAVERLSLLLWLWDKHLRWIIVCVHPRPWFTSDCLVKQIWVARANMADAILSIAQMSVAVIILIQTLYGNTNEICICGGLPKEAEGEHDIYKQGLLSCNF